MARKRAPVTVIAIIGGGPKALAALDRLAYAACTLPEAALTVTVFDEHDFGSGRVWSPDVADSLRVNFAADKIDLWAGVESVVPARLRRSLSDWLASQGLPADPFPPRRLAGEYLSWSAQLLVEHLPPSIRLHHERKRVRRLIPNGDRWRIETTDGSPFLVDQVLLATGHEQTWNGALAGAAPAHPTTAWEARVAALAPGSPVLVRGFALTFIDVALRAGEVAPHVRLHPVSRSGLPMVAKPLPGREPFSAGCEAVARWSDVVADGTGDPDEAVIEAVVGLVGDVAPDHASEVERLIRGELQPPIDVAGEIDRTTKAAYGLTRPGPPELAGHAWRCLCPAISSRLADPVRRPERHAPIADLQRRMERIAFGPPARTSRQLHDRILDGNVALSMLNARIDPTANGWRATTDEETVEADVMIDAVLAPPGVPDGSGNVTERLLADGLIRRVPYGRGVDITDAGLCRRPDETTWGNLAALGRPTEDATVGNDTLNMSLHATAANWAHHIIRHVGDVAKPPNNSTKRECLARTP